MRRIQTGLASHFERWSRLLARPEGRSFLDSDSAAAHPSNEAGERLSLLVHTERASTTRVFSPASSRALVIPFRARSAHAFTDSCGRIPQAQEDDGFSTGFQPEVVEISPSSSGQSRC